jgi:NAD(P)-dependent dehydrogenase (short-subunit alcohol dehydrogenase family)
MELGVTGYRSQIVQEISEFDGVEVQRLSPRIDVTKIDRYLLCAGVLHSLHISDQSYEDQHMSLEVNLLDPVNLCEKIFGLNSHARICVIGSESGFSWSYDGVYAASKAALHRYVETRRLQPEQQLVCIAPGIIGDAGMTLRRTDTERLREREAAHPKRRFLTSKEVARMAYHLLFVDEGYTTNVVIRMNGGEHAARN